MTYRVFHRKHVAAGRPFPLFLYLLFGLVLVLTSIEQADADFFDQDDDRPYIEIHISGVDRSLEEIVKKAISISSLSDEKDLTEGEIRSSHRDAEREIQKVMESEGYYDATLESSLKERTSNWWVASYHIVPGKPVLITKVDVKITGPGRDYAPLQKLIDPFALKTGERFQHESYEKAKGRLLKRALEDGYLDARLTEHVVEINRSKHQASIRLTLETGERYRLGHISVVQDSLDPDFIQKFITLREGDFYSSDAILEQQNILASSDYYSEVYVRPQKDQAVDYRVPVNIDLVFRKKNKYSIGLGYSTDTGVRGSLGWERRLVNAEGQRVSAELFGSKIGTAMNLRYRIPILNPRDDEVVITSSYSFFEPTTSQSAIASLGVARLVMRDRWRETLGLDYENEDYIVGDQEEQSRMLIPSATWTLVTPRHQVYVSRGYRLTLGVRAASDALLSDVSFVQGNVDAKWIVPVGKSDRLITRGMLGATAVASVYDLPASIRYFTGGDQTVRGYAFESLGPVNDNGEVIGGKNLVVGSAEYVHRIADRWGVAAFYDFGNAFNSVDTLEIAEGAGIGLRWQTPIGAVRFDVATALSEPDRPWRIHLWIGPDL